MNEDDIKMLQSCLNILTNNGLEPNGHFGHYTEKVVKTFQEKNGFIADGIVTTAVWNKMKGKLTYEALIHSDYCLKIEELTKRLMTKSQGKEQEIKEIANKALENKKIIKDKQIKEATESLNKIQSELINFTSL